MNVSNKIKITFTISDELHNKESIEITTEPNQFVELDSIKEWLTRKSRLSMKIEPGYKNDR